ncbi:MAG: UDP-4-amino-4,6-dideoxy-N-acetyl-beta-L-altrosamine transaminase [Planctomycetaceae bacterium]|nr:UDP-4-amino-4,6-dideoxy-N-acetyl-beta-L-altrosamine transaminase [Planctomycetaceae bacterium]
MLPYSKQWIDDQDVAAVVEVLRSNWLTTGPKVDEFEQAIANFVGVRKAVAVSNGTAALHCMMEALGIGPGGEVIVPAITFAATANCVVYQGGTPVFVDVAHDTLLIDPQAVEAAITPNTRAIIAVDFAGQPCDYDRLQAIADRHGLSLVADACHSIGGTYKNRSVGNLAEMTAFSFHPVKPMTTGEGGMITTDAPDLAASIRSFRNHGIDLDHRQREQAGGWFYQMTKLGFNYRLSDLQCALGISQLRRLPVWLQRRQEIAGQYDKAFDALPAITPLTTRPEVRHAYHLYIVRLDPAINRRTAFHELRQAGIGVNVHYVPVHLHPFYQERLGTNAGLCPVAETAYEQIMSLPVYPAMRAEDVNRVVDTVSKVTTHQKLAA